MTKEEAYIDGLTKIQSFSANDSITSLLESLKAIPEDLKYKDAILNEMDKTRVFPDSLMKIVTMIIFLISERDEINHHYEEAMERYETLNTLTAKAKPTEDEAKIKKTLTDFILKVESIYEIHDKANEGVIKELNRYMLESNIKKVDSEHLKFKLNNRSIGQIQPHLASLLDVYFQFLKTIGVIKRLIKISNFIIEDAEKR